MSGAALAAAAEALAGTPFRLHGRDPATGLDCVGLIAASLQAIDHPLAMPNGYRLRAHDVSQLIDGVELSGAAVVSGMIVPGDVLLVRIGPCQFHMLIMLAAGRYVHAHAGLKRIVICPGPIAWPVVRHWRLSDQIKEI